LGRRNQLFVTGRNPKEGLIGVAKPGNATTLVDTELFVDNIIEGEVVIAPFKFVSPKHGKVPFGVDLQLRSPLP